MLEYLKGKLKEISPNYAIIEVAGLGLRCLISLNTYNNVKFYKNSKIILYTFLHLKDDGMDLYGFFDPLEREVFTLLNEVSGIGPKVALSVLSWLKPEEVVSAIATEDVKVLTSVPGVGNKTARKIVFELKDKVKGLAVSAEFKESLKMLQEAREALSTLGFSNEEIQKALNELNTATTVEEIIAGALKRFAKEG
ncbi:Holliday junction ATP-dependent DNA helicase RuvA [Fervidicola ferrireducens]|uniref:Holliday junction branch migration complex subunit RuvA n=1 Tax=Fervidicola ferrireducens TaxID=520764 RepID=A0A140LCE8_9FIRM|nr:Holliday junction branch migration protein RuvA [Fervidicola ferrireducens]KXG78223.1 Holliday junction ATP-dependent DNA helicase RuvA [Fervidicola ferrireducens]